MKKYIKTHENVGFICKDVAFSRSVRKKTLPRRRVLVFPAGPGRRRTYKNIGFGTFWSVVRDYGLIICVQGAISSTMLLKSPVLPKTASRDQFLRFWAPNPKNISLIYSPLFFYKLLAHWCIYIYILSCLKQMLKIRKIAEQRTVPGVRCFKKRSIPSIYIYIHIYIYYI